MVNSNRITVSDRTRDQIIFAVDHCGLAAGIGRAHIILAQPYPWQKKRFAIYHRDVKKITLALRLFKVVMDDMGDKWCIDGAIEEIERKMRRIEERALKRRGDVRVRDVDNDNEEDQEIV